MEDERRFLKKNLPLCSLSLVCLSHTTCYWLPPYMPASPRRKSGPFTSIENAPLPSPTSRSPYSAICMRAVHFPYHSLRQSRMVQGLQHTQNTLPARRVTSPRLHGQNLRHSTQSEWCLHFLNPNTHARAHLWEMRTDLTAVPHAGLGYHFLRGTGRPNQ